jgi:hypothetical protein
MIEPGDDMDELFQRAGIDYPLKSPEGDFDAIATRLLQAPAYPVSVKSKNKKVIITVSILIIVMLAGLLTELTIVNRDTNKSSNFSINAENYSVKERKNKRKQIQEVDKLIQPDISQATVIADTRKTMSESKRLSNTEDYGTIEERFAEFGENEIDPLSIIHLSTAIFPSNVLSKSSLALPDYQPINLVPKIQKRASIYAGFAAGPQLNEVKRQGMKKTGIDLGIITGYQFSRKLSVETGLFFSHKTYFSEGKYFQMKKADPAMPSGMEVVSLEGSSSVLEVPLKLKYDLFQERKSNMFSAVGLSSYILTKEKNNYLAMMNGSPQQMTGRYKTASRYLAAAVNLSAGYEFTPANQNTIRIEPYIQIPIRGIGVGSIPVTSVGIHIGVIWNHK